MLNMYFVTPEFNNQLTIKSTLNNTEVLNAR